MCTSSGFWPVFWPTSFCILGCRPTPWWIIPADWMLALSFRFCFWGCRWPIDTSDDSPADCWDIIFIPCGESCRWCRLSIRWYWTLNSKWRVEFLPSLCILYLTTPKSHEESWLRFIVSKLVLPLSLDFRYPAKNVRAWCQCSPLGCDRFLDGRWFSWCAALSWISKGSAARIWPAGRCDRIFVQTASRRER